MAYLALDIGVRMGWALERSDGRTESGVKLLSQAGSRDGTRFRAWRNFLTDIKARLDSDDDLRGVVFERVDFVPERSGPYASHIWGALWGIMEGWADAHGIPTRGVAVSTIKKVVTGNGHASKDLVIKTVQKRWPAVTDDNEADALAVLLAAHEKFHAWRR